VVILEEAEHARRRGATIWAELAGYGASTDAYHITAPDPEGSGAVRAMRLALADAGMTPDRVDYINAHGTGTRFNDAIEAAAIKKVFGERARHIPISSIKSMTGHLLGAAGAVELIASVLAIQSGIIPPTINCDHPDPEPDLDYVPHRARKREVRVAMSNSFGFGGHNVCLIVKRWEE